MTMHEAYTFCKEHLAEGVTTIYGFSMAAIMHGVHLTSIQSTLLEQSIKMIFVVFTSLIVLVVTFFGKRWLENRFGKNK